VENHVPYQLYRAFHSRDFPATPVTMLIWSRLVNNEGHFAWKTVRSAEEEHRAEEEITVEISATQMAEMWLAAQRFQPAAVFWNTTVSYHNSKNERRQKYLPCEMTYWKLFGEDKNFYKNRGQHGQKVSTPTHYYKSFASDRCSCEIYSCPTKPDLS